MYFNVVLNNKIFRKNENENFLKLKNDQKVKIC